MQTPKQTLILDSSQISSWSECPEIWNNRGLIAINKTLPEETLRPSEPITAGTLGHKYLELYYKELALSGNGAAAVRAAISFDPDLADFADRHQYPLDLKMRALVRQRFADYILNHPPEHDFRPATKRLASVGLNTEGQLCDTHMIDPLVEKGFSYKLYESREYLFVLEGRIDFMGYTQDGTLLWMDHKFQMREHLLYHKSIQFRNYSLATGLNMGVINYVRLHKALSPQTFVRQPISFSSLEMRNWKQELTQIFVDIAQDVAYGNYRKNRDSCSGKWGRPCQFTPLCEEYNPQIREAIRKRDFVARIPFRPW